MASLEKMKLVFQLLLIIFSGTSILARSLLRKRNYGSNSVPSSSIEDYLDSLIEDYISDDSSYEGDLDYDEYLIDNKPDFGGNRFRSFRSNILSLSPLECNSNIEEKDCNTLKLSSLVDAASANEEVVIPCGSCAIVDYTDGSTITFDEGLSIQGKLYFPSTANVEIYTTHVFVMGVLEMDPPADQNIVKFRLFGSELKFLHPVGNNEGSCGSNGCEIGMKPFVVAGGQVKIQGLADPTCPSWVNLVDLKADNADDTLLNRVVVGNHAASCWKIGDTIALSSPTKDQNESFETKIINIDTGMGEIIVESSIPTYFVYATLQTSPDFAVEVTSLSRSIIFTADDDSEKDLVGGHFVVYNTPNVVQLLEGVEVVNFGQQGYLGRYPIHFHMSGDVSGSVVSKNVVHHSNQRGYVVHGSHNIHYKNNVAYEVFGHCFMIEDGIESGNFFDHNLAMGIRKPSIPLYGENDDEASAFWISNPKNRFVGNVAAGSENTGFWFDTRFNVRGPSRDAPGAHAIRPFFEDLIEFRSNTAHSNRIFGFRYYSIGWRPTGGENILQDIRTYRNTHGHFIHSNTNIAFVDGIIADNDVGVRYFQNSLIRFDNITLRGHTSEYDAVLQELSINSNCLPRVGLEFYMFPIEDGISTKATNLEISDFDSSCATALTMSTTQMYDERVYRSRDQISNIHFEDNSNKISFCNAMSKGANTIAIHDLDGSLDPNQNGISGFVVSDEPKMVAFADGAGCTAIMNSCAQFCQGICLRNIRVTVSTSFLMESVEMVVSDGTKEVAVPWGRHDYGNMHANTMISEEAYFGIGLPAGSYAIDFRDRTTGEPAWPAFAFLYYEDPPEACSNHLSEGSIAIEMPEFDDARCIGELLADGTFENLSTPYQMGGWLQRNMDLELVNIGMDGSGYALRGMRRQVGEIAYISQYIDRSCLSEVVMIEFSADVRFQNPNNEDAAVSCEGNTCPKAKLEFIQENTFEQQGYYDKPSKVFTAGTISSSEPTDGWYKMEGSVILDGNEQTADIVILKIYQPLSNENNIIIDNISLTLNSLEFLSPNSSPLPDGDSAEDEPETGIGWVTITEDDFEDGWGNFLPSTGKDVIMSGNKYHSGYRSAVMRFFYEPPQLLIKELSVSEYSRLKVNFWFIAKKVDEGENFVLERDFDDGEGWVLIGDWVRSDQGFQNDEWAEETVMISTDGNEKVQFRFRLNGSDRSDKIFIDDVTVSGEAYVVITPAPSQSGFFNLALNKPTEQISVLHSGFSELGVDGDTNFNSCIFTGVRGWWEVDLEVMASISHIKIYNSNLPWHLKDAFVSILDSNKEVVAGHQITEHNVNVVEINFESLIEGRYVHISLWENLSFCEVEVYGINQDTESIDRF